MIFKNIFQKLKLFYFKKNLKYIKLIACDVDGVLTNNNLVYTNKGEINRNFNVKDGLGIKILQSIGIEVCLISGGRGESILERAKDLNIKKVFIEVKNKSEKIAELKKDLSLKSDEIIYVGDDINDLIVKNHVLLFFAPKDSHQIIIKHADYITSKKGGEGAIREIADIIINSNKSKLKNNLDIWTKTN